MATSRYHLRGGYTRSPIVTSANGSKRRPSISNTVIYSCTKGFQASQDFRGSLEQHTTSKKSPLRSSSSHVSNCHFCKPPLCPSFFGALGAAGFKFAFCA